MNSFTQEKKENMEKGTEVENTNSSDNKTTGSEANKAADSKNFPPRRSGGSGFDSRKKNFTKNPRKPVRRNVRTKPEFDQKIISIRRVTRVVTGGRRFSFSVALVAGNKKGSVGVGIGKGGDTALAIEKAYRDAKNNMVEVNLTKDMGIPHEVESKFCSSHIVIMPSSGSGVVAGSSVRTVIEMAGIKGVSAKILSRSKNKLNNARSAVEALKKLKNVKIRDKKGESKENKEDKVKAKA